MMADLNGKVVFVAGGAGNIGAITVRGCLRAGATVVTASRDTQRFERLHRFIEQDNLDGQKLITLTGNLGDEAGAAQLRDQVIDQVGVPDAVVTSLGGGMEPSPLLTLSLDKWQSVIDSNLISHLLAARAFLPPMIARGNGAFMLISGYGGMSSWANSAPVSIAAAGVISLARNLAAENARSGVRIKTMVLATNESLWAQFESEPGAYRGEDVGEFMAWLVSDAGVEAKPDTIYYVTDWNKANAVRALD